MGGGRDLDLFSRKVEANAQATFAHTFKSFLHKLRAKMRNIDPHRAILCAASGADFHKAGARDAITGGTLFAFGIIALHVTLAFAIEQMGASAAQSFFQ